LPAAQADFAHLRRQLLSHETSALLRRGPGPVRVAVVYPGPYAEGMATLAVHVLLELFNQPPCFAERSFAFETPAGQVRTLESGASLADFDLLLVTLPFELQYLTMARMLARSGIPPLARERTDQDPLVVCGGPAVSANPAPVAALADLVYVGEVEAQAAAIREQLAAAARRPITRRRLLGALAEVPGFLDCAAWLGGRLSSPVGRQWAPLADYVPRSLIVAPGAELSGRVLLEVARGCRHACRFCLARQLYCPVRFRGLASLRAALQTVPRSSAGLGLIAANFADHPEALDILGLLKSLGLSASVSSLRADTLLQRPQLLDLVRQLGQRTVTIAPEAGTERLRRSIGKPLRDADLRAVAEAVRSAGFERLKLYFMIGLPGEQDEDVEAIAATLASLRDHSKAVELTASVACFVPKAHTPFEGVRAVSLAQLRARAARVRRLAGQAGIQVEMESPRLAQVQAVLARGGPELGALLAEAGSRGAAETEFLDLLEQTKVRVADYAARGAEGRPWQIVMTDTLPPAQQEA
jgi:radical SAM superfamily enzyme YgiQ (UPF0313 family)